MYLQELGITCLDLAYVSSLTTNNMTMFFFSVKKKPLPLYLICSIALLDGNIIRTCIVRVHVYIHFISPPTS